MRWAEVLNYEAEHELIQQSAHKAADKGRWHTQGCAGLLTGEQPFCEERLIITGKNIHLPEPDFWDKNE